MVGDVAEVGGFVGDFYQFGTIGNMGGMFDLGLFAFGFRQGFVIGDGFDVAEYGFAELFADFLAAEFDMHLVGAGAVFDYVVQQGGDQDVVVFDAGFNIQDMQQADGVVDVGRGVFVFAALVAVLFGGVVEGADEFAGGGGHGVLFLSGRWFQDKGGVSQKVSRVDGGGAGVGHRASRLPSVPHDLWVLQLPVRKLKERMLSGGYS